MAKQSFDPGLTQQFAGQLRRTINKDGTFNVHRSGSSWRHFSAYLFLVDSSWPRFIAVVLLGYLIANLVFAEIYLLIGIDNLAGSGVNTGVGPFGSAFFFSVHTLTTVGYGSMYPKGLAANIAAAVEAMLGVLGFALATGLLFARFSRPSARIVFSQAMLVSPYEEAISVQFRIANERSNNLMELEARVLLMTVERGNGELRRIYADLPLERSSINFFPLTWTVVHPVDSSSPLYGKTAADLAALEAEFLIMIKGFDDTFSQTVNARYSYRHDEMVWGARFLPVFHVDHYGDLVLELNRIDAVARLELP